MTTTNNEEELKYLNRIETPFGVIYIEKWGCSRNAKYADDRITIYDSRKDFLDYFPLDYFYENTAEQIDLFVNGRPDTEEAEQAAEEEYNKLCEMLAIGGETASIAEFMDWIGVVFYYAGPDKEQAAYELSNGHPEELLPDELETNEYVNHIGDNYIVVADC